MAGLLPAMLLGDEPTRPGEVVRLFNGKDLAGLTTWLKDTGATTRAACFA